MTALFWAVNTQLGEILPDSDCTRPYRLSAILSLILATLGLLAGLISWRSTRTRPANFGSPRTLRFGAEVSTLAALIFVFALAMQALAGLMLTGCER